MTASTSSSSTPGTPGSSEPRHRSSGGRGYGRETETSGPIPTARREGGRHRAPDAPPSSGFRIVPSPREAEQETGRTDVPDAGFRPLPPSGPTAAPSPGLSSIGVPLGAVPAQREPAVPRRRPDPDVAVPRRRPARTLRGDARRRGGDGPDPPRGAGPGGDAGAGRDRPGRGGRAPAAPPDRAAPPGGPAPPRAPSRAPPRAPAPRPTGHRLPPRPARPPPVRPARPARPAASHPGRPRRSTRPRPGWGSSRSCSGCSGR